MYLKVKDLSEDERPYEKFVKYGVDSLSDIELIAVILKSGTKSKSVIDLSREILLTKDNSYEYNDEYLKYGFNDYLLKPLDRDKLFEITDKYLK